MALQISYTDKEGDIHNNSYWVISDVKIFKRFVDNPLTPIADEDISDHVRYAGYYGEITVAGWRTKADRDNGKSARFIHSIHPTGWWPPTTYHEITTSESYRFTLDPDQPLYDQAYIHLKTLPLFANAVEL